MSNNKANDLFEKITNQIIAELESGVTGTWSRPWKIIAGQGTPVNTDGKPYRGINALVLPFAAIDKGYSASGVWGTYKAWAAKGCQVRKGEKSTEVVIWKQTQRKDKDATTGDETTRKSLFAATFNVFHADQVEGSDEVVAKLGRKAQQLAENSAARIDEAERYFAAIGATVRIGGNVACYIPVRDEIHQPELAQFDTAEHYYATLGHEHAHWTGAKTRLDRDLSGRFGSNSYAVEELVAELSAAFIGAQLGIGTVTRDDHAKYLANWISVLRENPKVLVTVASQAQKAVDYLNEKAGAAALQTEVAA